jgi:hypothetical protein
MNTKEHNRLIKVIFDGSKHLNHVMNNEEVKNMTVIENRFPLTKLPVCGSCEGLAYWGRDSLTGAAIGICRKCGTQTKSPITYSTYLASGYDIDTTGATAKEVLNYRSRASLILPDFGRLENA